MNVPDQIARAVRRFGQSCAAICGDERRSFLEIDERTNRLANALRALGLAKGDRVATLVENSVRCVELDFALAKAGLVRVSLNPRSVEKDVQYILADSGARVLVAGENYGGILEAIGPTPASVEHILRIDEGLGSAAPAGLLDYEDMLGRADPGPVPVTCDPEDLYCLFYTSGTTGKPKGVMLSHRAILQVSYNLLMEVGPQREGEKVLLMQPMSHGAGFFVLPWFIRGGASVIMRQFDPAEVLRLTRDLAIETVKLIPTMLQRVLRVEGAFPIELPHLRQMIYGASPMPTEALRDAIAKFGPKLVQIYGQSEAPVTLTVLPLGDHEPDNPHPERLASAGVPFTTVEIRIVDDAGRPVPAGGVGEVVLKAPQLMHGYWGREDLTAEVIRDGWLHTKDMGRMDEDGYVYLLGRKDEMIISGGYNIAPREVEEALYSHPAIQEAAVIGEPDAEWGSAVVAYVALRFKVAEQELLDFVKPQLGFKRPKRIYTVRELPKNSNGKIQKIALKPDIALAGEE
jgi:acyl-CoA synthetase (AMP-forming)/AMP-acid ligase II